MPRFPLAALLLPAIALPLPATAQTMAPTALVEAFLADHGARMTQDRPPLLNDGAASALYLVDSLAQDGLQGRLGFDPVYNAQDIQITGLRVFTDPEAPILQGAAQVWVAFENFGEVQEMAYTLVTTPEHGHWQISDIYSVQGGLVPAGSGAQGGRGPDGAHGPGTDPAGDHGARCRTRRHPGDGGRRSARPHGQ